MPLLQFDCRDCGVSKKHGLTKGTEFKTNKWVAQCFGCGKLTLRDVDDKLVADLE